MKKLLLIALTITLFSCTKQDVKEEEKETTQIEQKEVIADFNLLDYDLSVGDELLAVNTSSNLDECFWVLTNGDVSMESSNYDFESKIHTQGGYFLILCCSNSVGMDVKIVSIFVGS